MRDQQAVRAAKSYLDMTSFSRSGLMEQLESSAGDEYTHEQAVYGVTKAGLRPVPSRPALAGHMWGGP